MSRFNTGNPLGSNDPRDLDDNAKNMDLAVNSEDSQWIDRFGRPRLPLMEQERRFVATQERHEDEFQSAQERREGEFLSDQERREDEFQDSQDDRDDAFDASQASREARFNDFIASSGYQFAGDYAPGIEITEYNQLIRDSNGEFWRVSGQVDLPYVTTGAGIPEDDALVPAGDAVLRQDLANPDKGASMVAGAVRYVQTIDDLAQINPDSLKDGQSAQVVSTGRAGLFRWQAGDLSAEVAADPERDIYVPAGSDDGSLGAWVFGPPRRTEGPLPGFSRNALAIGVGESSSIGEFWGYERMDGTGFLSSNTARNRAWLAAADTFQWLEVETPFGVIIGDSIAEGHPALHGRLHPEANGFDPDWPNAPGQPSYELSMLTNMHWYNHGIGGQTTSQVWARWRRDVLAETFNPGDGRGDKTLDRQPYCVWVNCGINDISFGVPLSVTKLNLMKMALSAQSAGIVIGFNTCGPHMTHDATQIAQQIELCDWMLSELPRYGAYVFDFRTWFADPANPDRPNPILSADNVHPTKAGYISYAAALVQQTAAPIVMGQLSIESKVDPDGMPTNLATPKGVRVEHVDSGLDSVARFAGNEARAACNFNMTNTTRLRLSICESTQWPPSSAQRAAISKVRGVFGTSKSLVADGRSAFCVIRHDNANKFHVSDFYDMQDVIDASIIGTTHIRVRFTRPVKNVQAAPYGSLAPYGFGVSVGPNPRERIIYVYDRETGASIDPNTASGTFFVNITAE